MCAALSEVEKLKAAYLSRVVETNYFINEIANSQSPEGRRELVAEFIKETAQKDLCLRDDFVKAYNCIDDLQANGEALRVDVEKRFEDLSSIVTSKCVEVEAMSSMLRKADERTKAHRQTSEEIREKVWCITIGRCFYCNEDIDRDNFHVDHIVPKAAGGPDHLSNYVPACARCNSSKSDKPFAEFFLKAKAGTPHLTVVSNQGDAA